MWKFGETYGCQTHTHKVQSPVRQLPHDAKVEELIDWENMRWRNDLIDQIFWQEEATLIKKIPLSDWKQPDHLIWAESKDGKFTVRSAYRLVLAREESNHPSSSCFKENTIWRKIWKLNVPPKTKHFLWRALINSLPTKMKLKKWGVQVWEVCDRCGADKEDTNHILWLCLDLDFDWLPFFFFFLRQVLNLNAGKERSFFNYYLLGRSVDEQAEPKKKGSPSWSSRPEVEDCWPERRRPLSGNMASVWESSPIWSLVGKLQH